MDLARLMEALSQPDAYPYPVESVAVCQTHISVVFLAGDFVYKVKKPVTLSFLDFGTLAKRQHACQEEVRLNKRMAPSVYLGVVPVTATDRGLSFEGEGEPLEWAVKMKRLPEEATLEARVKSGTVTGEMVAQMGQRLARFHQNASTSDSITHHGRYEKIRSEMLAIYDQTLPHVGITIHQEIHQKAREKTEFLLSHFRPIMELRGHHGKIRDCHGDLHLDHIYFFPDEVPPHDWVMIDCIEFNDRFRCIDVVSDMAFAAMDFRFLGRSDLADTFLESYFGATRDEEGKQLASLYTAYRASIRGMVDGVLATEKEVSQEQKNQAIKRGKAHWLLAWSQLAWSQLASPAEKPCLVLLGGLPGTGKSTVAGLLHQQGAWEWVRSDRVRKELLGLDPLSVPTDSQKKDLYRPGVSEKVYHECARMVESLLFRGKKVIVDATFRYEAQRHAFHQLGVSLGVEVVLALCQASPEIAKQRIAKRRSDPSDADGIVYDTLSKEWEPARDRPGLHLVSLDTDQGSAHAADRLITHLKTWGLA